MKQKLTTSRNQFDFELPHQEFHFELQIKGERYDQLHWLKYTIVSKYKRTGKIEKTEFDVADANSYPPLDFSKICSNYSACSMEPLKEILNEYNTLI